MDITNTQTETQALYHKLTTTSPDNRQPKRSFRSQNKQKHDSRFQSFQIIIYLLIFFFAGAFRFAAVFSIENLHKSNQSSYSEIWDYFTVISFILFVLCVIMHAILFTHLDLLANLFKQFQFLYTLVTTFNFIFVLLRFPVKTFFLKASQLQHTLR